MNRKQDLWQQLAEALPLEQVAVIVIGGVVLIGALVWLRRLFGDDADSNAESLELLTQFRDLHQQGELSDVEFRSIKSRLIDSQHVRVGVVEPGTEGKETLAETDSSGPTGPVEVNPVSEPNLSENELQQQGRHGFADAD